MMIRWIMLINMLMVMKKKRIMRKMMMTQESKRAWRKFLDLRAEKFEAHENP